MFEGGKKKRSRSRSRSKKRAASPRKTKRRSSSRRKTPKRRKTSSVPKKSYTLIDSKTGKELGGRYVGETPMEAARKVKIWRLGLRDTAPKAFVVLRQTTPGPLHGKLFAYNIVRRRIPASPAFFALTGRKTIWDKMLEAMDVPNWLRKKYETPFKGYHGSIEKAKAQGLISDEEIESE